MIHHRFVACCAVVGLSLLVAKFCSADEPPLPVNATIGFPTGTATPEGVAADLVRAFINRDPRLFNNAREIRLCEGSDDPGRYYAAFLERASFATGSKTFNIHTLPNPLKRISKVFVARSFGPHDKDAKAYSDLNLRLAFLDAQKFVDVVAVDSDGTEFLHRTIVVKQIGGAWFAVPPLSERHWTGENLREYSPSTEASWTEDASDAQNAK